MLSLCTIDSALMNAYGLCHLIFIFGVEINSSRNSIVAATHLVDSVLCDALTA